MQLLDQVLPVLINNTLIKVYPVPSKGKIFISLPLPIEKLNFEWFDISGKKTGSKAGVTKETEIQIDTPGIYLLKIFSGNDFIATKKLVVE